MKARSNTTKTRSWTCALLCTALSFLPACSDQGGGAPPPGEIEVGTLAYVDSACQESGGQQSASQSVRILHGETEHTVLELHTQPAPTSGACAIFGIGRSGIISGAALGVQRFGVTPDGEHAVFEVTDDFADRALNLLQPGSLSSEQEGFFSVRADGSDLRSLGPPSRYPQFNGNVLYDPDLLFSPDGRQIVFTDLGAGPEGQETAQIFLLDVESGARTQVTHLPQTVFTCCASFIGKGRIGFISFDALGERSLYTMRVDGSDLALVPPLVASGGVVIPSFEIVGSGRVAIPAVVASPPVNGHSPGQQAQEVFVGDGVDIVQVTDFRRVDTALNGAIVSKDGERVFVTASADPFGRNPSEICQLFSVGVLGGDLRQLTFFSQQQRSELGCAAPIGDGCGIGFVQGGIEDTRTGAVVFDSSCDPFGNTPVGQQIYAILPDGSGLRQLTHTAGLVNQPDGSLIAELPGPWAYGPHP